MMPPMAPHNVASIPCVLHPLFTVFRSPALPFPLLCAAPLAFPTRSVVFAAPLAFPTRSVVAVSLQAILEYSFLHTEEDMLEYALQVT